jgi:hypothetical protein
MAIRSLADVNSAYEEGRVHVQRFFKGSNATIGDGRWQDWSFSPGQPAYDARIGTAGVFTPLVATRNDAIWFPGIAEGQTRHLMEVTFRTLANGTGQARVNAVVYDLLGVYPLLDGDSTDIQAMDNTEVLPRYGDGVGVFPVLVNHVAPMVANAAAVMTYLDHNGVEQTVNCSALNVGVGCVCSGASNTAVAGALGGFSLPLTAGSRGARAVTSLQFVTPPGGLFAIYMVKQLTAILNNDNVGNGLETIAAVRPMLLTQGFNAPRVYDGAHLGMFMMPFGGARNMLSLYGTMEFIWG